MRIHPIFYGILVLTVFFGIILGFQAAGIWSISGKVDASGTAIGPSADDVNTIKGWMTLEQISATYNVPLADLLQQFSLPADTPATTAVKDLESVTFETAALRDWLQSRAQEGSVPLAEPTQQSTTAPVTPTAQPVSAPAAETTLTPTDHVVPTGIITGKTTFQELLDWGVSQDAIQKAIGEGLPAPATVIKDYATGKGLEFAAIKTLLQDEVDKLP
jgi:hypothetical protein